MPNTEKEPLPEYDLRALVLQHPADIATLRNILELHGVTALDNDLAFAWAHHSSQNGAAWAQIPENTRTVLVVLLRGIQAAHAQVDQLSAAALAKVSELQAQANRTEHWVLSFEELPIPKGGGTLHLPPDLCIRMGLRAGHRVDVLRNEDGDLILRRRGA